MAFEMDQDGWDALVKEVISTQGVPRMKRVADACNEQDGLDDGYRVSVEGPEPLRQHDYRATVITATGAAIRKNARNNTLIKNFHQAGGG